MGNGMCADPQRKPKVIRLGLQPMERSPNQCDDSDDSSFYLPPPDMTPGEDEESSENENEEAYLTTPGEADLEDKYQTPEKKKEPPLVIPIPLVQSESIIKSFAFGRDVKQLDIYDRESGPTFHLQEHLLPIYERAVAAQPEAAPAAEKQPSVDVPRWHK